MISGNDYIKSVKKIFHFLIEQFNYKIINENVRTNLFYDIELQNEDVVISISYENREDYLQVILFKLKDGKLPDYEDKKYTIHLEKLNNQILTKLSQGDFLENNIYFSKLTSSNEIERRLIKSAKELRLCLKNS